MGIFDNSIINAISDTAESVTNAANDFLGKSGFNDALAVLKKYQTSNWQGLSPHLIAKIYPLAVVLDEKGERTYHQDLTKGNPVLAPILDGAEIEYQLNWQSPFEQTGVENKAPALSAMLQSGVITQIADGASEMLGIGNTNLTERLQKIEGRTGITKINSMQTFSGMPPVKCSMKLLFRAYKNAKKEVNDPICQLLKWALPQELSKDGAVVNFAKSSVDSNKSSVDAFFPSLTPVMVAMEYKGRVYKPMVIESISDPITSPTTKSGHYARAEVSITLCSLTAWDKGDITQIYARG